MNLNHEQQAYFKALASDRENSADTLEKPSMRGIKKSVVEKYSDQAHFIYELLQNADDAKATSVRFELYTDKLVFAHNGAKRFSVSNPLSEEEDVENGQLGDINAITSIANSNKTEASIGKFGVGFKAVFQYTSTPHIYDPIVFFKIERFIVPVLIQQDYLGRKEDETLFVFPFDHDKCGSEEAYAEISEKLQSLDYPLLFLTNVKAIEFEISDILGMYGKSIEKVLHFDETTVEFVRLTQKNGGNSEALYDKTLWLFSRNDDNDHKHSVGYLTNDEGYLLQETHNAFCFFPTKEYTGLNFIIHAPFLLTDSREGIRAGEQHNIDMISHLAKLAADSFKYLKEIGVTNNVRLINDNIFNIIPYDESKFTEVDSKKSISFKPFFSEIQSVFKNYELLPSQDGYVSTQNAYWASVPQIAEVFNGYPLTLLTKNIHAKWVFSSLGRQETVRNKKALADYIDSITSVWLDEGDILKGWSIKAGDSYEGVNDSFIEKQPIDWLHQFYAWIASAQGRIEIIKTKKIFLNQNMKATAAFDDKKQAILFLPTEDSSGYSTVNEVLLKNEDTLLFLQQLGVGEPDLRDEIYNIILPQYKEGEAINTRPHFKKFFQYYQVCSQTEAKSFLARIKDCAFVLSTSVNSQTQYRVKAEKLYFPFKPLIRWFQLKPKTRFISFDEYLNLVGEDKKEELITFFKDLGVSSYPKVNSHELTFEEANQLQNSWTRSTREQRWIQKNIDGLQEIIQTTVEKQDIDLSSFIWSQMLEFVKLGYFTDGNYYWLKENNILWGRYEYFHTRSRSERFESTEARCLRSQPWLLNNKSEFVSASGLNIDTLNSQYDVSSNEAIELLRMLGIPDSVESSIDEAGLANYAESLGLSEDEQRKALQEYAKRKKNVQNLENSEGNEDNLANHNPYIEGDADRDEQVIKDVAIERVAKEIIKRAVSVSKEQSTDRSTESKDAAIDEDEYSKQPINIENKIEKVKQQAEQEIQEIARLENLKSQVQEAKTYSYKWFKALLELESLNSSQSNSASREVSISFAKVELEVGTTRTLIMKHPSRYIPQSMEDLADIPLELHFADQSVVRVAIEVVNVKSYTLRAKLRTNAEIGGRDLSLVTEARIQARNPVFLIEELRKAFLKLGEDKDYNDDFDMQSNLCKNIEFIFGPPGTGKTTYVARDIIQPIMDLSDDFKVLVLTPTNKSADVLVRRLMENMNLDKSYLNWLVRFGVTNDSFIEQSGIFRDKTFDIRTLSKNVTVTTIARFPYDYFLPDQGTRLHLNALKWDYIIIDEASMIPLANIIYPLYKKTPEKFIIAGDPFQIEPITIVDTWKNENIYSVTKLNSFTEPSTFPHPYPVKLLMTQYRSIPEIGEVFSRFTYGGILKHHRNKESQRDLDISNFIDLKSLNIIKFPVSQFESIYRPKRLQNKTPYQVYSALFSFEFIKTLTSSLTKVAGRDELFKIGLIAPYRAQADLIDKLMTSFSLPKNVDVQVGTIHGFQGDECDIIIALFNPPPKISTHKEMFLNKMNIINVSISRARDYLIILMPDDKTEDVENLTLIKKVESLCKEQTSWSEQLSPVVEEKIFGSSTYLEDNSFSTSHQLVNVYGNPEKLYEIRSEENAIDVQVHEK